MLGRKLCALWFGFGAKVAADNTAESKCEAKGLLTASQGVIEWRCGVSMVSTGEPILRPAPGSIPGRSSPDAPTGVAAASSMC